MLIPISSIKVKRRVRKDLGNLEELKASLRTYGLLNPITINSRYELIAGERRLTAAKELGWTNIHANIVDNLTEIEQLEMEIEENNQRKEFTDEELLEGYKRLERMRNPGFFYKIYLFFKRLFQKITDFFKSRFTDEMNVMDKILYVRDYIHDNIQTNHLDASVLNYMFASPQQVWESNCALPIEKNILLAGVLQSLGNDAQLAFMGNSLASDLKTVVRIQRNGATDYISANEIEELSLDAFFAPATLIMQDGKIENVTAQPISVERVAEITLESGKLDDPVVKMEQKVESPQMKYLLVHGTGATEVSVSQLTGKYYEMTIDDGQYGTPIRSVNIHNDRKYDVDTKESSEKYGYTVKLPANARCLTKTSHKEITVEGAKLLIDVVVGGNTIMITRTLSLPKEGISAKSSKKFKAMMGEWETPVKVVFSL